MSKFSKSETYNYTRRLYRLLKNHGDQITFRKLRGAYGVCDEDGDIVIDISRGQTVATLFHEAAHFWNQDWEEEDVERFEKRIMQSLTTRQIRNVLKSLGNIL